MHLPEPRGAASRLLLQTLTQGESTGDDRYDAPALIEVCRQLAQRSPDSVPDDDLQLTLYLMYELHYGGLPGVPADWEWSPDLLAARAQLERRFERDLRAAYPVRVDVRDTADLPAALFDLAADGAAGADSPGESMPAFVARRATRNHVAEALVLRSPYQLKEADPHTFAIPRLYGRAKAALVEIQADEYGGGRPERMHSALFARTMRALGLDDTPGTYLDLVPALSLAATNAVTMFALHRRLRGALCGHLAAFEMTSSLPAKRYVAGLERLGLGADATEFFDEHVEADAVHEQVAAHDLCGALVQDEPELVDDVLLGAAVCLGLDGQVAALTMRAWSTGDSALRQGGPRPDRSSFVCSERRSCHDVASASVSG